MKTKKMAPICNFCLLILLLFTGSINAQNKFYTPPATPLVTSDPYFSIWSFSDHPGEDWTRHWTGSRQEMVSMIRIDGKAHRLIGKDPSEVKSFPLIDTKITPTQTTYYFGNNEIKLSLTFTSPLLTDDLDLYSLPISYVTWKVESADGKNHDVSIYFDNSAQIAVNTFDQEVNWSRLKIDNLDVMSIGTREQQVLRKAGDDLRIDWGYLYLVAPGSTQTSLQTAWKGWLGFINEGKLPSSDDMGMPKAIHQNAPAMAAVYELGKVGTKPVEKFALMAYDDKFSIEYFNRHLQPYWKTSIASTEEMLKKAVNEYSSILEKCNKFDNELLTDLTNVGGEHYAALCALSYRQSLAACKLAADVDGSPLFFPKENYSNGCISTVDVIYPQSPILLFLNPELLKAQLTPVLEYSSMKRWKFNFAPHDLGTYPKANGQVYGGGETSVENQMPVEESGNMLLLMYAIAYIEKSPDYSIKYWAQLEKWAQYLKEKGFDPENQLCTDDFAGHLAHNVNLSLKSILALGAYSKLCTMAGKKKEANEYWEIASESAKKWEKLADDGDHFRLAFDRPNTWSQKYNLIWDEILEMNLFSKSVAEKELKYYKTRMNKYGLPLDNRADYTKLDWTIWTATLAKNKADFEEIMNSVANFVNDSPDRAPLTDWYSTTDAKKIGFQARSVVGGVFSKVLSEKSLWEKWINKAQKK